MDKTKRQQITSRTDFFYYAFRNILLVGLPFLIISTVVLSRSSIRSFATTSGSDNLSLTLSTSCTINSILAEPHTISMGGGQYENEIGSTRINAYCNDGNGYGIYAIGSSGNVDGNTDLVNSADNNYNIHTGIYDSNNITASTPSSWSMKLTAGTGSGIDTSTGNSIPLTPPTIMNNYDSYNIVPNNYTLVAKRTSGTNMTIDTDVTGSYFTTTYAIYATSTQPAGTYNGKVKYVMVHPNSNNSNTIPDLKVAFAAAGKQPAYQDENGYYYAMQDMTSDICNSVTRTGEATATQLVDLRDNKLYWAAKLDDDKCWMTQNLDLDIGGTNVAALTSENTDISTDPSVYSSGGIYSDYGVSDGVYTWNPAITAITSAHTISENSITNWSDSSNLPYSVEGGDTYYYTSNTIDDDIAYSSLAGCELYHTNCLHYHSGNYYNYSAAVASNNSNKLTTDYSNADNSVCPKNWRLPIAVNSDQTVYEFGSLMHAQGITDNITSTNYTANGFNDIRIAPLYFVRSGYISHGHLSYKASYGRYWPSTINNINFAYSMYFNKNNIYPYYYYEQNFDRYIGRSIRCLAR